MITEDKPLIAIDINEPVIQSDKIAYYRIPQEVVTFLRKCEEDHDIIGFSWEGGFNFGVILKDKEKVS